ncbi:metallophosphoesterase [Candidatus Woesearchaeota archaeon]|nr:metallophosphoesterase [Candidatus Woesearchaeota archaeon]
MAKSKKMKILATGDIHGDTGLAKKLADKAEKENVDLVVICGDITYAENSTDNLIGPFVKKGKKVMLIPGNHESFATADFLSKVYNATNLHGYAVKVDDGIGLFGCGGANIGINQLTEEEMFEELEKGFKYIKDLQKKIMVTHVHPSGALMDQLCMFPGSTGIQKAVEKFQPDILFCCHVHEAEGVEEKVGNTRVINVGRQGKIIEL